MPNKLLRSFPHTQVKDRIGYRHSSISRLQNLARLNPSVDQSEIKNLQTHQTELEAALAETPFCLDFLQLVVCEN